MEEIPEQVLMSPGMMNSHWIHASGETFPDGYALCLIAEEPVFTGRIRAALFYLRDYSMWLPLKE